MKGDFTRLRFDPRMHYDSVLMQQGRVQTDADWNEQVLIAEYRNRTQTLDTIGPSGAPQDYGNPGPGAFLVYYGPDPDGRNRIFINHGRYYVDGLMVESEAAVPYDTQPGAAVPPAAGAGTYLVYLDVWKRHITALEDPGIREPALAGADSGTRSKMVWQARMERVGDLTVDLGSVDPLQYGQDWQPAGTASTGALDAKAGSAPLENLLYRVEVHRSGSAAQASFKWSRDNGTIAAKVLTSSQPIAATVQRDGEDVLVWQFSITIDLPGRDSFTSFLPGQLVELSCDEFVLQRKPGVFGWLTSVSGNTLNVAARQESAPLLSTDPDLNPLAGAICTVRRWDNTWNPDQADITLLNAGDGFTQGDRLLLEHDLTVSFAAADGAGLPRWYQTGDYWLIPARTVSGLDEWAEGQQRPPAGEPHSYAPLALVKLQADGAVATLPFDLRDMRTVFPTLRSLAGGAASIVQGTGVIHRIPKWQSTDGAVLVNSHLVDDGSQVSIEVPLQVGTATDSQAISRFTSSDIESMSGTELPVTAPTAQGVKHFVEWALPAGTVLAYASETVPDGWLACNGFQYDGSPGGLYSKLFSVIAKTFGPGNGSTYGFNVPDLRGRVLLGAGAGPGLTPRDHGSQGGEETHELTLGEMPMHTHGIIDPGHNHDTSDPGHAHTVQMGNNTDQGPDVWVQHADPNDGNWGTHTTSSSSSNVSVTASTTRISAASAGGSAPHNTMPPYFVLTFIIKY